MSSTRGARHLAESAMWMAWEREHRSEVFVLGARLALEWQARFGVVSEDERGRRVQLSELRNGGGSDLPR